MSLNTKPDVLGLIYVDDGTSVQVHLDAANLIVVERLSGAGMSAARLKLIELYLAAHFTAIAEEKGGLTRTGMGQSQDWFSDIYTSGFGSTRFGQSAVSFDESGVLAKMGTGKGKAEFRAVRPGTARRIFNAIW